MDAILRTYGISTRLLMFGMCIWSATAAMCLHANTSFKYYLVNTVAVQGLDASTAFSSGLSIDGKGDIAFIAIFAAGEAIYYAPPTGSPTNITPGFESPTRSFLGSVQVNGEGQVGARDRVTGSPPTTFVRRWDASAPDMFTLYTAAGTGQDFDGIVSPISINDAAQMSFGTLVGSSTDLTTAQDPGFSGSGVVATVLAGEPIRPVIADSGDVVIRKQHQVLKYSFDLSHSEIIAGTPSFAPSSQDAIGLSPGISKSGKIIAFSGALSATGATLYGGLPGDQGIFVSVDEGTGRRILRLDMNNVEDPAAGWSDTQNLDGYCDIGESCKATPVGYDSANPIILTPDFDGRVSVIHQELGAPGLDGDAFVVVFVATPSFGTPPVNAFTGGQKSVWSVTAKIKSVNGIYKYLISRPIPVVQVGDTIEGVIVGDLGVYDSVAPVSTNGDGSPRNEQPGDHRIAIWTSTSGGQRILEATWIDSDQDGLPDHWETLGVHFDGTGPAVILPLANPAIKDLYVEVDALCESDPDAPCQPGSIDYAPDSESLSRVVSAFANAPDPITIHWSPPNGVDEHISVNDASLKFIGQNDGNFNDFGDLKNGTARSAANSCSTSGEDAHFGTEADRGSPDCQSIIGAKRLVYRYVLFGKHNLGLQASGQATIMGGDVYITIPALSSNLAYQLGADFCGVRPPFNCSPTNQQRAAKIVEESSTLMHELGHTLNLRHGGSDNLNCKPNYFSVMNYAFQFPDLDWSRPLDFSREDGPVLSESLVDEMAGVGSFPLGGWSRTFHPLYFTELVLPVASPSCVRQGEDVVCSPLNIDFNGDGTIEVGPVQANVNYLGAFDGSSIGCGSAGEAATTQLYANADWTNVTLDLRYSNGDNAFGAFTTNGNNYPEPIELIADEIDAQTMTLDSDLDGVPNSIDNCPRVYNPDQSASNDDGIGDACEPQVDQIFLNGFD